MDKLNDLFNRFDMVCDDPSKQKVEILRMPEFFSLKDKKETSMPHVHDFYEIIWFRDGGGVHTIDFTEYEIKPESLFLVYPGQVHSFDSTITRNGYVVKICKELLGDITLDDRIFYRFFSIHKNSLPYYQVSNEDTRSIIRILECISSESTKTDSVGYVDLMRALVKIFIICVARGVKTELSTNSKISCLTFIKFAQLIEGNYRQLHTVKEYASLLNISVKTLTNYVSYCSDSTPLALINSRVALEAKRLLRYSTMSVKEIGCYLGFEDPSYFVKFFKRMVGVLPGDFKDAERL